MAHPDVMKAGCNENKRKVASLGTYASKRFRWPHVKDSGSHHIFQTLSSFQLNPLIYTLSASLPWERWNDPGLLRTMGRGICAFHNCFCFCSSSIAFLENLIFKIILFCGMTMLQQNDFLLSSKLPSYCFLMPPPRGLIVACLGPRPFREKMADVLLFSWRSGTNRSSYNESVVSEFIVRNKLWNVVLRAKGQLYRYHKINWNL